MPICDPFNQKPLEFSFDEPNHFKLKLGYQAKHQHALFKDLFKDEAKARGLTDFNLEIQSTIAAHASGTGLSSIPGVRNTIAVASGKGGVGKSTTAVNLALALQHEGAKVGILDADIYGPSISKMLGADNEHPQIAEGKKFKPVVACGLQSMSFGYLVDVTTPAIWRGPMVTGALIQLLEGTLWDDLDYLVIDLPPGTGDIHLTLCQKIPVTGAIIVTTPQDIALLDARKGLEMFNKVSVPVLGIVENMSTHICSSCGHEEGVFGTGGGERLAAATGTDLLGQLPLDIKIRQEADGGKPTVLADPDHVLSQKYRHIALKAAAKLALQKKDYSQSFPKIVVE